MLRLDDYECGGCGWRGELLADPGDVDSKNICGCPQCGKTLTRLIGAPRPVMEPFHRGTLIDRQGRKVRGRFEP